MTDAVQKLLDGNEALSQRGPDWLQALRATGAEQFTATGLPTPKWEDWKYTTVRGLEKNVSLICHSRESGNLGAIEKDPCLRRDDGMFLWDGADFWIENNSIRLVFVDGRYEKTLNTQENPECLYNLANFLEKDPKKAQKHLINLGNMHEMPFLALNTAQIDDGFVLNVPDGQIIEQPIEILYYNTGTTAFHPRNLLILGQNACATVIEHHIGAKNAQVLANHATETWLEEGAKLAHYRLQKENISSFHIYNNRITCEKGSEYNGFTLNLGAKLSRTDCYANLISEKISCNISGSYAVGGDQHCDTTVTVNHMDPHCQSQQYFKGVADNEARAVYQGKINVSDRAYETHADQCHHALLLAEGAEVDSKPELVINTDDVTCSHGAACGQLDPAALFYLQSRGFSETRARAVLISSFLNEALDKVERVPVRDFFAGEIETWLEGRE